MDMVLNPKLAALCAKEWITPYIAYERVRQLLAPHYVTIKSVHMLSDEKGHFVVPLTPRLKAMPIEYLHFTYERDDNIETSNYLVNAWLSMDPSSVNEDVRYSVTISKNGKSKTVKVGAATKDHAIDLIKRNHAGWTVSSVVNEEDAAQERNGREKEAKLKNQRDTLPKTTPDSVTVGNYKV